MAARFKAKILTPYGLRTCFEARVEREGRSPLVARFGEFPSSGTRGRSTDRTSYQDLYTLTT
jgi:hypothetical protein